MIIDEFVKIKEVWGKNILSCTKAFSILLAFFFILKTANMIDVYPILLSSLSGFLIVCLVINYSPQIRDFFEKKDFTGLRIKFFNNAHRLDKALALFIATPIWAYLSYAMAIGLYVETSKELSKTGSVSLVLFFCAMSVTVFYFVAVRGKRLFLVIRSGIFEGVFKPSMIKENDKVIVISDDERGQYSGVVISKNNEHIKQMKAKEAFKKRFNLPFDAILTSAVDIGFGMYIDAPQDRITIVAAGDKKNSQQTEVIE